MTKKSNHLSYPYMKTNIIPKTETIISNYGNGIAVGLRGTREQIELAFNRFFNLGATGKKTVGEFTEDVGTWSTLGRSWGDGFLHYMGEGFAYFLSSEEKMVECLKWEKVRLWQDSEISAQYKGAKSQAKKIKGLQFLRDAFESAQKEVDSYPRENFMGWNVESSPNEKGVREGSSDWDEDEFAMMNKAI